MSLTPSERNLADAYEKCPGNPMSGAYEAPSPESPKAAEPPVPVDLEAAGKTIQIAADELSHLCHEKWAGRDGWHWEIPANPARDTDLRIDDAIGLAKDLVAEVKALRSRLSELEGYKTRNEGWKAQHDAVVAKLALERQLQAHMRTSIPPGTWDRILSTFPKPSLTDAGGLG